MILPIRRGSGPFIMGILNVTPDSFSDGGRWNDRDSALKHALDMIDQGADIIDVGAESTRPGSVPVSPSEEWSRLEPVLRELIPMSEVPISVDTMKPDVAAKCISLGADIINDVNGLRAEGMIEACAGSDVSVVISHMPEDMHGSLMGPGFREEIRTFIDAQCAKAADAGIDHERMIVDPGIGFGKTMDQNLQIVEDLSFLGRDHPILIGVSRKRFVVHHYPEMDVDEATAMLSKRAVESGADIVRVHDVEKTFSALRP